uniref:Uncharacterized protein n=1 Tax=Heterorhabditis bacteriophora TaxID=37862 RepID=A0A1I7WPP7_HETBA
MGRGACPLFLILRNIHFFLSVGGPIIYSFSVSFFSLQFNPSSFLDSSMLLLFV